MGHYVDIEFVDGRLALNNRWAALTEDKKEAVIAACEAAIDDLEAFYCGTRKDENQDGAFPRNGLGDRDQFTESAQMANVKRAVVAQIEAGLSKAELGKANWNVEMPIRLYPQLFAELAPLPFGMLKAYTKQYV